MKDFLGLAATDLGLGDMLGKQRDDQTDEEARKKRMGMSLMNPNMNFGMTGIASVDLGMQGAGRR